MFLIMLEKNLQLQQTTLFLSVVIIFGLFTCGFVPSQTEDCLPSSGRVGAGCLDPDPSPPYPGGSWDPQTCPPTLHSQPGIPGQPI